MLGDINTTKGLSPGVDRPVAVFAGGVEREGRSGSGVERVEEVGLLEEALERKVVFEVGGRSLGIGGVAGAGFAFFRGGGGGGGD